MKFVKLLFPLALALFVFSCGNDHDHDHGENTVKKDCSKEGEKCDESKAETCEVHHDDIEHEFT